MNKFMLAMMAGALLLSTATQGFAASDEDKKIMQYAMTLPTAKDFLPENTTVNTEKTVFKLCPSSTDEQESEEVKTLIALNLTEKEMNADEKSDDELTAMGPFSWARYDLQFGYETVSALFAHYPIVEIRDGVAYAVATDNSVTYTLSGCSPTTPFVNAPAYFSQVLASYNTYPFSTSHVSPIISYGNGVYEMDIKAYDSLRNFKIYMKFVVTLDNVYAMQTVCKPYKTSYFQSFFNSLVITAY